VPTNNSFIKYVFEELFVSSFIENTCFG